MSTRAWARPISGILVVGFALRLALFAGAASAETLPARGEIDDRLRVAAYNDQEVYRLVGRPGYQIDIEFAIGESFLGIGSGDLDGLSFVAQDNHLFVKPKASRVATNLTVLTNRRQYQFDYSAAPTRPGVPEPEMMFALRFTYPVEKEAVVPADTQSLDSELHAAAGDGVRNYDYWYCGHSTLRPALAFDDGVQTHLRFNSRAELPAIFVHNQDGTESLVNSHIDGGDVVLHRVAQRFVLRRGSLAGCVVNRSYDGSGVRLESGTIAPGVSRQTSGVSR